jgi:hypothetical protein
MVETTEVPLGVDATNVGLQRALVSAQRALVANPDDFSSTTSAEEEAAFFLARGRVYADAVQDVFQGCKKGAACDEHCDEQVEVQSIYIAALMQLSPWRMWQPEFKDLAARLCALFPSSSSQSWLQHPGCCHFHIHLMEGAPTKQQVLEALPAAAQCRVKWPACGHLLHMASHIDVHLGEYAAAVDVNTAAVAADEQYAGM